MSDKPEKSSMNATEAAIYIGVSKHTVLRAVHNGHLPAMKLGPRSIRIRKSDIDILYQKG